MKLLCILITLALVNVSPIMTAPYANSVFLANKWIKEAAEKDFAGLETAISNTIDGVKSIATLNLMWATPEAAFSKFKIDHDNTFIINLPEYLAKIDQTAVQEAISQVTNITVSELSPNENFPDYYLETFGNERRAITGKIIKKLLIDAIDNGSPDFPNLRRICLLIALLRSMRDPQAYIITADVDPFDNFCILTSRNGRFKYQPQEGPENKYIAAVMPRGPDGDDYVDVLDEIKLLFL